MECAYCKGTMNDKAIRCPHCYALTPKINRMRTKVWLWISGGILVGFITGLRARLITMNWGLVLRRIFGDPIFIFLYVIAVGCIVCGWEIADEIKEILKGEE